jgi:hypothetical protein
MIMLFFFCSSRSTSAGLHSMMSLSSGLRSGTVSEMSSRAPTPSSSHEAYGGGGGGGSGEVSSEENRRKDREQIRKISHSAIERRRRDKINDKIRQMRSMVPQLAGQENLHKLTILQGAIDHIAQLTREVAYLRYRLLSAGVAQNGGVAGPQQQQQPTGSSSTGSSSASSSTLSTPANNTPQSGSGWVPPGHQPPLQHQGGPGGANSLFDAYHQQMQNASRYAGQQGFDTKFDPAPQAPQNSRQSPRNDGPALPLLACSQPSAGLPAAPSAGSSSTADVVFDSMASFGDAFRAPVYIPVAPRPADGLESPFPARPASSPGNRSKKRSAVTASMRSRNGYPKRAASSTTPEHGAAAIPENDIDNDDQETASEDDEDGLEDENGPEGAFGSGGGEPQQQQHAAGILRGGAGRVSKRGAAAIARNSGAVRPGASGDAERKRRARTVKPKPASVEATSMKMETIDGPGTIENQDTPKSVDTKSRMTIGYLL